MKTSSQDKAAGAAKSMTGQIKESAGKVLGARRLETKGRVQKLEGRAQNKLGEVKATLGK